jgi:hypothetical protein
MNKNEMVLLESIIRNITYNILETKDEEKDIKKERQVKNILKD